MEIWDIYNENYLRTGETISRNQVASLKPGQYHACVNCLLIDEVGDFLVQQRSLSKETRPGVWDIFTGGSILAGETPLEGLEREIAEELGLEGLVFEDLGYEERPDIASIMHYFLAKIPNQLKETIQIQETELERISWWPLSDVKKLAATNSYDLKWLQRALEKLQ